jgi:uncharacterized membrane protein YqgA involved in biofilm formation
VFTGIGTVVNVATVLLGAGLGVLLGHRLPQRTRDVVTDGLGLVTIVVALLSAYAVTDTALVAHIGGAAPLLVVLGSILLGGIAGSLLHLERRVAGLGGWLQQRLTAQQGSAERHRFVEGFVASSLLFCTGPLTVLGSLNDGLGRGADELYLKAVLDGFAAMAFAASFGWGVAASALTVVVVQGGLTLVGVLAGDVLPTAYVSALTATGGVLLLGVALRLLRVREIPVADLLPALLVAPFLVALAATLR